MSYFGSIYFKMPNGLVAGLRNVFDDGKIEKGSNIQFDRQARLSFIPLKNIRRIYNICDNHTNFKPYEYENEKLDDIAYKELNAYMKPKRNAMLIETYDNKLWCWGNGDYIGESYKANNVHNNVFVDEPKEFTKVHYNNIKKIIHTKRTSSVFNGTIIITKDDYVYAMGYGNLGDGSNKYYYGSEKLYYTMPNYLYRNVENIFITRDCLFILYKNGTSKVYCVNNTYGQSGIGDKRTERTWVNIKINTTNLVDICDYIQKVDYEKAFNNLLQGKATTLFVYRNGYIIGCGSNFETLDSNGNKIKCFNKDYLTDDCAIKPVKTNLTDVMKIQNEIILYGTNLTNNSIINKYAHNNVKDFNSYCTPYTWGIYFLDRYDNLKCLIQADSRKALSYYTNKRDKIIEDSDSYKVIDFNNFYNVRNWTLKDNVKHDFKMELYKNTEEYLCDIPKEYVDKIEYKLGLDINNFEITVPRYLNAGVLENPLYTLIKSRQQVVVTDINNIKSRYILKEGTGIFTKTSGSKTFKAYSIEKSIMNNTVQVQEGYYNLNQGDKDEDKGIIETIMGDTIFDIGCVDTEAKKKTLTGYETKSKDIVKPSDIFSTTKKTKLYCIKEDIKYGDTLYTYHNKMKKPVDNTEEQSVWDEKGINIGSTNKYGENPSYITLIYNNVVTGDLTINSNGSYNVDNEVKCGTQVIKIEKPISCELVSIQAIANNQIGKRNSIKHIITYLTKQGNDYVPVSFEQVDDFVKCATDSSTTNIKRYITWDSITIQYTKGDKVTTYDTVEFKYEDKEESIDSFLTDISDTFTCTFEFDTMNNFIHCFDGELKNLANDSKGFTLGKTQIGDMALGGVNAINMAKVIDKLNSDTNVELTYDDITQIETKDSDDDIISGLKVKGKDDLSIKNYNPLGSDTIENWSYFINNGLLSEDCEKHLNNYLALLETKQNDWDKLQNKYSQLTEAIMSKETTITICKQRLQEQNAFLNTLLTDNKNVGDKTVTEYTNNLNKYSNAYTTLQKELEELKKQKDELEEELLSYSKSISRNNIKDNEGKNVFTYADLQELAYLQSVQEVSDDYFTDGKQLYEYYKKQLEYKVKGLVEFTTTTNNMMRYYMYGGNLIRLGNIYELDNDLKEVFKTDRVKLIQYNYYPNKYENGSIEDLVFSNQEKIIDEMKLFRKNTQIKTENNTKSITTINAKIQDLQNQISQKQDLIAQQDKITKKIIYGNLIASGEKTLSLVNVSFKPRDWSKYPATDKNNLPFLPEVHCIGLENVIKQSFVHFTGTDGKNYVGWENVLNISTEYSQGTDYNVEIMYSRKPQYSDTQDNILDLVAGIKITKTLYENSQISYNPMTEGVFKTVDLSDSEGYKKLPYVETDSDNFVGYLPIKVKADLKSYTGINTTTGEKTRFVDFVYEWYKTQEQSLPVNDINIQYRIFDYPSNYK